MKDEHGIIRKYKHGYSKKFSENWSRIFGGKEEADGDKRKSERANIGKETQGIAVKSEKGGKL